MSLHKVRRGRFLEAGNTAVVSVVKCTENQLKKLSVSIISELHIAVVIASFWVEVIDKSTGSLVFVVVTSLT